eukprot:TRINITY_DN18271_c0_g1_i4.p1 TRINITY_DN18271_c0_g1~~TRINITY_DN18271_c0_g1_i4.p1  ORF type:complete len:553 (+),score=74.25 TRINITY_DN18271_c0_g1_i4:177-1835(+)
MESRGTKVNSATFPPLPQLLRAESIISSSQPADGVEEFYEGDDQERVHVWQIACAHTVVEEAFKKLGWRACPSRALRSGFWDVAWADSPAALYKELGPTTAKIRPHQRLNHFPLINLLCRKDFMASTFQEVRKGLIGSGVDLSFMPRTWCLPLDLMRFWCDVEKCFEALMSDDLDPRHWASILDLDEAEALWFIAKPQDGARGEGIKLFQLTHEYSTDEGTEELKYMMKHDWKGHVVQSLVLYPHLLDGFKWDMRVYVLVTCLEPLTVYLFDDGLARLCTEPYTPPNRNNMDRAEMHLTNFSINKDSATFDDTDDETTGSKRSLAAVLKSLDASGEIWETIAVVVVQTLLCFQPKLWAAYKSHFGHMLLPEHVQQDGTAPSVCFDLLGFDFLLDESRKLHLLEVNASPSMATSSPLDCRIKSQVLKETFEILALDPQSKHADWRRRASKMQERQQTCHLIRRDSSARKSMSASTSLPFLEAWSDRRGSTFGKGRPNSCRSGTPPKQKEGRGPGYQRQPLSASGPPVTAPGAGRTQGTAADSGDLEEVAKSCG